MVRRAIRKCASGHSAWYPRPGSAMEVGDNGAVSVRCTDMDAYLTNSRGNIYVLLVFKAGIHLCCANVEMSGGRHAKCERVISRHVQLEMLLGDSVNSSGLNMCA